MSEWMCKSQSDWGLVLISWNISLQAAHCPQVELRAPVGKIIVWGSVHQCFFFEALAVTVGQVPLAYLAYPWSVTYIDSVCRLSEQPCSIRRITPIVLHNTTEWEVRMFGTTFLTSEQLKKCIQARMHKYLPWLSWFLFSWCFLISSAG